MADTPTPKRGYKRPVLGTKPWKAQVDFNWAKIDNDVGGLMDGTFAAARALAVPGAALVPYVEAITGTLSGILVGPGNTVRATVDHSVVMVFDVPAEPIVSPPAGVNCTPLLDRSSTLSNVEYGGKFALEIVNSTSGIVSGATINWRRKGWKVS